MDYVSAGCMSSFSQALRAVAAPVEVCNSSDHWPSTSTGHLSRLTHCRPFVKGHPFITQAEADTKYSAPNELHGFELVREQFVQEYNSQVLMYRHKKTGPRPPAALLSSVNSQVSSARFIPRSSCEEQTWSAPACLLHALLLTGVRAANRCRGDVTGE